MLRRELALAAVVRREFNFLPGSSLPCPCSGVTPAPLNSARMPCVLTLTMPALRFCIAAMSIDAPVILMPCAANSCCAR